MHIVTLAVFQKSFRRKFSMSLVEILVAIVVLSTVVGMVGINAANSIQEARFKSDFERVKSKLNMACEIAHLTQAKVGVKIESDNGVLTLAIEAQHLPESSMVRARIQEKIILNEVSGIDWDAHYVHTGQNASTIIPITVTESQWKEISINSRGRNGSSRAIKPTDLLYPIEVSKDSQSRKDAMSQELYPKNIKRP